MKIRDGFVGTVGNTPLIKLRRASEDDRLHDPRQGRVPQPRRLGQGPRGALHHQGRRGARAAAARAASSSRAPPAIPASASRWSAMPAATAPSSSCPRRRARKRRTCCCLCGVDLRLVPAVPYANPMNYVRYSGRLAEEIAAAEPNGAIWANQFDNLANRRGHYETTGPEIWERDRRQGRRLHLLGRHRRHAFRGRDRAQGTQPQCEDLPVRPAWARASTAGTPAASSSRKAIRSPKASATTAKPRTSKGFAPDGQYQITDAEMLPILFSLVQEEGLVLGGSTGINVCGAIRLARELGPGPHDRDDPRRFRHPLPVQAVQPGIPEGARPADPAWLNKLAHRPGAGTTEAEEHDRTACFATTAISRPARRG